MEPITAWVAVGVFAAVVGGEQGVNALAASTPFGTQAECEAHLVLVQQKLANVSDDVQLIAHGETCAAVKVKYVAGKPNV